MYYSITDMRRRNLAAGFHFFSPDAMRFFRSRILSDIRNLSDDSALFITSEKNGEEPRRYTLRRITDGGNVDTVGEFQAFTTPRQARRAMLAYVLESVGR